MLSVLGVLPALVDIVVGFIETDGFDEGFILGLILGCDDGFFEGLAEVDGFNEGFIDVDGIAEAETDGFILGCADGPQSSAQKGPPPP